MKPTIIFLLLSIPFLSPAQSNQSLSYQEAKENCRRIAEEKNKASTGSLVYTGPDCMIGAMAPDFSVVTSDGRPFTTDSLKGKISILNFWMISCPPCIAEIPGLNNVVKKYGRDDFNFIAIGIDDEKDISHFLKNNPWTFDQLASGSTLIFDVFQIGWGFPTTFVLDEKGVIIGAFSGGTTDETAVQNIEDNLAAIIAKASR